MGRTTKLLAITNGVLMRSAGNQPHRLMSGLAVAQAAPLEHYDHDQELEQRQIDDQREIEEDGRWISNDLESDHHKRKKVMEMNWVPHPRTGIYYPEGQDWVMDGVPDNAASLGQGQTYWLRNIDGVEKPDPDLPSADHYLLNP